MSIQNELKEEGVELSIEEIGSVVESQFKACTYGFTKGMEVRLYKFGKFTRRFMSEVYQVKSKLSTYKSRMSKEEFKELSMMVKIKIRKRRQERKKGITKIKIDELLEATTISEYPNIYHKLEKDVRD